MKWIDMYPKSGASAHWYKEHRHPTWTRRMYRQARSIGVPRAWAMRIRHWGYPHYKKVMAAFRQMPETNFELIRRAARYLITEGG
jgi:hypothetical protein